MFEITVEPVLLFYMFATYLLLPASQYLIYTKVCLNKFDENVCTNLYDPSNKYALDVVQSSSSHWILSSTAAMYLPAMLSSQFLGSWSDIYGRKLSMLIPPIGGVFASFLYIGLSVYLTEWPISIVLFASFITGICGGFVSCVVTCMSYIAEITTLESRTFRVSLLESTIFISASLGPLMAGWIMRISARSSVFIVIMSFHAIAVLYTVIFVKDLAPRFQPEVRRLNGAYNLQHVKNSILTIVKPRQEKGRKHLLLLLLSAAVIMLCTIGEYDISLLYFIDKPINWTMSQFTTYMAVKNGVASLSLLIIMPLVRKAPDSILILIGICSKMIGYLFFAFAFNSKIIYAGAICALFNTWSVPVIRATMSKFVEAHEQGKMYACVAMVESAVSILGSVIFNGLYPVTREWFKGFIFILEAVLLIIPFVTICYLHKALQKANSYETFMDDSNSVREEDTPSPDMIADSSQVMATLSSDVEDSPVQY